MIRRKMLAAVLSVSLMIGYAPLRSADAQSVQPAINLSSLKSGIVAVTVPSASKTQPVRKLLVQKGASKQYYTLSRTAQTSRFPLTQGSGSYRLTLFENVEGQTYRQVSSVNANVTLNSPFAPFLQSVEAVRWSRTMAAIVKAKALTKGMTSNEQKAKAIYSYLTKRMKYDYKKAAGNLPSTYTPNIEETFRTGKGICYDTASLYASMLRSVGVPAKVSMGRAPNIDVYHAWNEVYVGSKGWVTMDVTVDATYVQAGKAVNKYKKASLYKVEKTI